MVYCATPATLRLELLDSSGTITDSLDLMDESNGYRVASVDLGFPVVREVKAALPTRDGDYDTTALFGPRVVTITGSLIPSPAGPRQQALATLAHWAQPRLRPRLVYAVDAAMAPLAIGLRGSQLASVYDSEAVSAFSVSWVAPDPVAYALTTNQITVQPQSTSTPGGRTYPLTYPRTYPAVGAGGSGQGTIHNGGDYPTWPTFVIYGPCTNPAIWWVTPAGPAVVFAGTPPATIQAGYYYEIDTFAQTVYENGLSNASRYNGLDFTQTVWAPCYAGDTVIRFAPATWSPPCQLVVKWNDASL
jgi:hypothetical protein